MRQNEIHNRGPGPWRGLLGTSLSGIALGLVFLFTLSLASSAADPPPTSGEFSVISVGPAPAGQMAVLYPSAPAAGGLIYDDFKRIEDRARFLLKRNLGFREDISPYQEKANFDKLVRQFDTNSGFSAQYDDPDPDIPEMTLQQRIDKADEELREARDLYAYLAVFAAPDRFRADDGSGDDLEGNNYKNELCNKPEDPNPTTDPPNGIVAAPIIDWCDFPARLRQSVREGAYLRMIFAQQFMVDALGMHFSAGALVGGDKFVREEVAKLQAAAYQYEQGEESVSEALGRVVGNNCYVSDFFTQTEWGLLSQMAEKKELAQHHTATRLSYLDINSTNDVPRQQALARDTYRAASVEGYLKTIGMAGRSALPPGSGCAGTPPESALVAEMAASMLETRSRAREMSEGRNIFGFDITFTPSRPYATGVASCISTGKGLLEEANCSALRAEEIQKQTENAERKFDLNQQDLVQQINQLNTGLNNAIANQSGCSLQGSNDDAFFACAAEQIELVSECDPTNAATFDACLDSPQIENSDLKQARRDMRTAWLALEQAQTVHDNILERADIEKLRNTKVKSEMLTGAQETSAFEAVIAAANCCTIEAGAPPSYSTNPGAFVEAGMRPGQILLQNAHDMDIEDAESNAVVRNLFLDQAEARYDIDMAFQQYRVAETNYAGVVWQLETDVFEAQRQRKYLLASPANDPAYRMVRDSKRLELADALDDATRFAYLAARRAEYEYTARLSGNNFRISDVYKARTANDVLDFLGDLDRTISSLPGAIKDAEIDDEDFKISVAKHVLGLTDKYLESEGFTGDAIEAERVRRLRQWVTDRLDDEGGSQVISFTFTTSSDTKGILSNVKRQGYDYYWLHKMAGVGLPLAGNTGTGLNLVSDQPNLDYRQARISQTGQVELTSFAGCLFNYRLVPDAVMLGLDWPDNQPTDTVTGNVQAGVNGANGDPTRRFLGRPIAAVNWKVVIFTGSPDGSLSDLDVQQLSDIELEMSTTFATRESNQQPQPADCVRADF